jgi:glycosyltransferase involved in cell wall biosynthesis
MDGMRIVVAHNYYKQAGGEDQCVAAEVAMLRAHGHDVTFFSLSNDDIDAMSRPRLAVETIWSRRSHRELRRLFSIARPQIVHFHNTFPLISPAAYYAARAERVGVVQTLHNFRLICANALLFREGQICEDCVGRPIPWAGVRRGCYRGSRTASAVVAAMLGVHRALGTWRSAVDAYIALTQFSRAKLVEAGLPAEKIAVKANLVYPDPGVGSGRGGFAVYVGRLSSEKGLETLLAAWSRLQGAPPLKIIGEGPLAPLVEREASANPSIQWLGALPLDKVYALIGAAALLVAPSRCYENFPRVLVEAFAKGTPVLASRMGAMAEIVDEGRTGSLFRPGDPDDLAAKAQALFADPARLPTMRAAARGEFERRFTDAVNHGRLMTIYEQALAAVPRAGAAEPAVGRVGSP